MIENLAEIIKNLFRFDALNILSSLIMLLLALVSAIYSMFFTHNRIRIVVIILASISSFIAIISINYIIMLVAIETLSGLCFWLILISRKIKRRLAISYFLIHAFAGVLMIASIIMNYSQNGSFAIVKSSSIFSLREFLMLASFIINVAAFPFMGWYTRTYSRTDSFSLVLLSAITTKTAFFIMWKIIPGSNILFEIGLVTLIIASFFALITTNIIKFLLLTSVASVGFSIMAVAYHGFLVEEGISLQINMQLVWYLASSVFSVGGFLSLYGFITNNECKDNSFYSIRNYLMECGSSMHFVIPAIVFGFCLASFPFTASFIAKSNITKFFVDETWLYFTLKASTVIFIMFAIKLILPVCYSVEFFKLDKRGRKLASILYMFVFLLMLINVAFFIISKVKINIFIFSVEFFTFIAYTCIAGVLLFMLEFVLKASNAKKIIEVAVQDLNYFRIEFFNIIQTTKAKSIKNIERITSKRKKMKEVLVLSKITPSASISFILILIIAFLTNKFL